MTRTFFEPNSTFYDKIIEPAQSRYRFTRKEVSVGICVEKCQKFLSSLNQSETIKQPNALEIFQFGDENLREKYSEIVEKCANLRVQSFSPQVSSAVEFCTTDDRDPYDTLDYFFFIVVICILGATALSTLFDYDGGKTEVLKSFSLISNWTTFTSAPEGNMFVFLDFLKVLCQTIITGSHVHYFIAQTPSNNTIFFESHRLGGFLRFAMILSVTNDILFMISGFLMTLRDVKKLENGKIYGFKDLLVALRNRYFRLMPMLSFTILWMSTFMEKAYFGPVWYHMVGREKAYCRKNYWLNFLFINNYVNLDTGCHIPSE